MKTLDAITAGRMALAGVARPRAAAPAGGRGLGMYPCDWRLGESTSFTQTTVIFTDANSHKAWRPKEHSP